MNVPVNTTNATYYTDGIQYSGSQPHELVYVVLTLLVTTLSALIASFLGLRRRYDFASASSVHGARSGSDGQREDAIRLQADRKCGRHDRTLAP